MHRPIRVGTLPGAGCRVLSVGFVLWAGLVSGQIMLDADFDHGSLDVGNSLTSGSLVNLAGRDNFNAGRWKWLYFSASNVAGLTPQFRIDDDFATGGGDLAAHAMVYSYDGQQWEFFDNNSRQTSQNRFVFSNNTAFTGNMVYVAYGLPYSYGRLRTHTAQLMSSPWVAATMSGDGSLVIGQSPGGVDELGRVIAPRDLVGYKITDPSVAGPKRRIALLGGVHANETLGNYTLEGLVDFLTGDDIEAARLRRRAEFYVYPLANPDGRFAGYNRSTVQQETADPNRFWQSPGYGGLDDIRLVGDALLADTGGSVDYFIDFHSTVVGKSGHYGLVHPDFQGDPFWQALLQLEPTVRTQNASLVDLTAQKFGRDELGAGFTMTFETQFIAGENIDRFHQLGRNMGLALERALGIFADLNFDGQLDGLDWQQFVAGAEQDLSGLSQVEAYARGDLDGDGVNGLADFGLFKNAYLAAHGPGAFDALFVEVPEPTTLVFLFLGLVGSGCHLRI